MTRNAASVKFIDIILIIGVLAIAIFSGFSIYGKQGTRLSVVIEAPSGSWIYDLKTDRTVKIPGALGNTTVEIAGGKARILDSPCPNKTCVAAAPLSRQGDWSACLPNKVILRVQGRDLRGEGLDAVAE